MVNNEPLLPVTAVTVSTFPCRVRTLPYRGMYTFLVTDVTAVTGSNGSLLTIISLSHIGNVLDSLVKVLHHL